MKKYKFKLDALLKIRKLKEETCKMEIGQIQVQISKLNEEIQKHNEGIRDSFESQESGLQSGMVGHELRFHPYFVQGKRSHIELIKNEIKRLEELKDEKFRQLTQLRADVKVIDQRKEKDYTAYKKNLEKKQNQEIEEQVQNWKQILG